MTKTAGVRRTADVEAPRVRAGVEDGVARVVLDHPPLNILTRDVLAELRARLADLADEPELRVVVLAASGRHFSAGASVEEHLPPEHEAMIPEFVDTVRAILAFPLPVVAEVRGRCLGGALELVLAADLVVAAEDAVFALPEIQLAVLPPVACALLHLRVGGASAAEMIYTGDPLDAQAAARAGLAARVVPGERLEEETGALARSIARHSGAALRQAKRAVREGSSDPGPGLDRAATVYTHDLMRTADALEGLQAFVEKRTPNWSHR